MPWQPAHVDSKTSCPRSALAVSIENGYLRRLETIQISQDIAESRFEGLEVGEALFTQQELHVRPNRSCIGAAVVVHRPLPLEVPPGGGVHLREIDTQGKGKDRTVRSVFRGLRGLRQSGRRCWSRAMSSE